MLSGALALAAGGLVPAWAHGDLHETIEAITTKISANSTNAELRLLRAQLYLHHEEPLQAIADYERALALNPKADQAYLGIGLAWANAGQPAKACAALDSFLALHPTNAAALVARARALDRLGRLDAAVTDFTRALTASSSASPELYLERAEIQARQGRIDNAIAGLDEGIARLGHLAALEMRAVDLDTARGNYAAALRRLDGQLASAPRKEFLLCRRADLFEKAGDLDRARADYRTAQSALASLPPERRGAVAVQELEQRLRDHLARLSGNTSSHPVAVQTLNHY